MKKLLLLFLVVFACAYSANAKTIYVENTKGWDSFYLYVWNGASDAPVSFPGTPQTNKQTIDGKDIYTINLGDYEYFILNKGIGGDYNQTSNLVSSDYQEGAYYYIHSVGTSSILMEMTLYTYDFTVTTSQAWSNFYIYLFYEGNAVNGVWPGKQLAGSGNVYTYSYNSFKDKLGVVFNLGQGQNQTYNLSATPGANEYTLTDTDSGLEEAVTVNIGASGFATLVSDKALKFTGTGITAYTAEEAETPGDATLKTITSAAANTPMLLKATAGTCYVPIISSDSGTTPPDNPSNNAFKAGKGTTVASVEGDYKNYILNSGTFYLANGKTVATNKAYLQLSAGGTGSKANLIFPNGEATSISSIMGEADNTNVYYNLQGQQVSNPAKGLYIVNGKKFINK